MIVGWEFTYIPDFLRDRSVVGDTEQERVQSLITGWLQFVGGLWTWRDEALFTLRAISSNGCTRVWLLARAIGRGDLEEIECGAEALLRSHRLSASTAVRRGAALSASEPAWLADSSSLIIRQSVRSVFWTPSQGRPSPGGRREPARPALLPWWSPGGSFGLPYETLVASTVPMAMSCYLQPTAIGDDEARWLLDESRLAKSSAEQTVHQIGMSAPVRDADPVAELAAAIHLANYRRLADRAFLTCAVVSTPSAHAQRAATAAAVLRSIVSEDRSDAWDVDEARLPSAAEVAHLDEDPVASLGTRGFGALETTERRANRLGERDAWRLPYLADARGASTYFRLPINVRSGVPGIPVRWDPPDAHPGPRTRIRIPSLRAGADGDPIIRIGTLEAGGELELDVDELTKHALITGFTGSGKSMTVLHLIDQVHALGTPVLIIESAKREYRRLLRCESWRRGVPTGPSLQVFTLANESCAPFRINPFEVLPGVRVESHLSRLQTCFEASLPPIGPLSSVICEALVQVYEERGWLLSDVGPAIGEVLPFDFPTMADFVGTVQRVLDARGYEGEVKSNVHAAVLGRLTPLTIGSKGLMLGADGSARAGAPREPSIVFELLSRSTILELDELGLEDKALVTLFVLTLLRELLSIPGHDTSGLRHVTVIEEAHNVLENVGSAGNSEGASADIRYKAVQQVSNMLSEVRALGEGLVIVDQSPEKLAPDAMRNTNLQIAHQLRDSVDRDAIARAMIMDDAQRDYIAVLEPGQAAVFGTGLQAATFARIPLFDGVRAPGFDRFVTDDEVREHMRPICERYVHGPLGANCVACGRMGQSGCRMPILAAVTDEVLVDQYRAVHVRLLDGRLSPQPFLAMVTPMLRRALDRHGVRVDVDLTWCLLAHLHRACRVSPKTEMAAWRAAFVEAFTIEGAERAGAVALPVVST